MWHLPTKERCKITCCNQPEARRPIGKCCFDVVGRDRSRAQLMGSQPVKSLIHRKPRRAEACAGPWHAPWPLTLLCSQSCPARSSTSPSCACCAWCSSSGSTRTRGPERPSERATKLQAGGGRGAEALGSCWRLRARDHSTRSSVHHPVCQCTHPAKLTDTGRRVPTTRATLPHASTAGSHSSGTSNPPVWDE